METTISGLYEIDLGRGLVLTANLTFHAKLSLLRILTSGGAIADPAEAKEMNVILSRVDTAFGERNTIVHGIWARAPKPGFIRRLSIRARGKKLQYGREDYSAAQLWAIADNLGDLLADFADLALRLGVPERLDAAPRHSSEARNSRSVIS
jgi:hypothetical protein